MFISKVAIECLIASLIFDLAICVFVLHRNNAVYNYRMAMLDKGDLETYNKLPDYRTMMLKFWIPVDKFIESKPELRRVR
jgi:hypothetical protein